MLWGTILSTLVGGASLLVAPLSAWGLAGVTGGAFRSTVAAIVALCVLQLLGWGVLAFG